MNIELKTIIAERMRRQRFIEPLKHSDGYIELFRLLQPVAPIYFSSPGDPPRLVHRTTFGDDVLANQMRERRVIVKGRFSGGRIGYVLAEDLEIYANAFRRPLSELNEVQWKVMEAIRRSETLTPRQLKEETGLLIKHVMPALHRLQVAFLVYEDQVNSDWERNWYDFAAEWPKIELNEERWEIAAAQVLLRFLKGHVFATMEQFKDWSQFPSKPLAKLIRNMEENKDVVPMTVDDLETGWICSEDTSLKASGIPPYVFMLHRSDILVRSHASELKRRFGDQEVLQYLLIDGEFKGAVVGHWRIGPHDVEDIIVELSAAEKIKRREEILKAVAPQYHPPYSHILKYSGVKVEI